MKCVICKTGDLRCGEATVTFSREGVTVIIKNVPAELCDNCGEYYLTEEMTRSVLELAEEAERKGAEIEVLRWAA